MISDGVSTRIWCWSMLPLPPLLLMTIGGGRCWRGCCPSPELLQWEKEEEEEEDEEDREEEEAAVVQDCKADDWRFLGASGEREGLGGVSCTPHTSWCWLLLVDVIPVVINIPDCFSIGFRLTACWWCCCWAVIATGLVMMLVMAVVLVVVVMVILMVVVLVVVILVVMIVLVVLGGGVSLESCRINTGRFAVTRCDIYEGVLSHKAISYKNKLCKTQQFTFEIVLFNF